VAINECAKEVMRRQKMQSKQTVNNKGSIEVGVSSGLDQAKELTPGW
jgi:hypothetical protein